MVPSCSRSAGFALIGWRRSTGKRFPGSEHDDESLAWTRPSLARRPLLSLEAAADSAAPASRAGRIELVAPSEVIGRSLRDRNGAAAGTIRNLIVDTGSGAIAFALVGTPASGDTVAAVPWSAIHASADARQPVGVDAPAARIAAAPHISLGEAAEALSPTAAASAVAWFSAAPPAQSGTAHSGTATLVPVNRMIGTLVYAADDSETVGDLDQVMLDLAHGHVAYCVVSRDAGFRTWVPVPFAALDWSSDLGDFTLRRDPSALEHAPTLPVERTETAASEADLGALYRSFGVAAYWQPSG
jgi:sporulation protein YlmC with PRC-barrel domain